MTKEDLKEYGYILHEVTQLEDEIESIKIRAESPAMKWVSDMPATPHSNKSRIEEAFTLAEELGEYLVDAQEALFRKQFEIEEAISTLEAEERILCRHRYIELLTWEEVCNVMCSSWNRTHTIHRKALEHLKDYKS